MDRFTQDKLNLAPKSHDELHSALKNFEIKWQQKARAQADERISR